MVDFSNISRHKVDGNTVVDFVIHELEGSPILKVVPAGEANKDLLNYILKNSQKLQKAARSRVDADMLAKTREEDKKTYAQFVVKGWEDVVENNGKEVEFNAENCLGFLQALPDHIFDRLRQFCIAPANFMNAGDDEPAEPATPKN